MFNIRKLFRSIKFAATGFATVFRTQQNFRIQVFMALCVIGLGVFFHVAIWQWIILILMILMVLILEMVNTSFELLVDMYKPRLHAYARDIKNIMAGMVFIAAISAVIVGCLIFVPAILRL